MTHDEFDELLKSYDPIDVEFMERFCDDRIIECRKMNPIYTSFIPSKEEAERILLIEPLSRLIEVSVENEK